MNQNTLILKFLKNAPLTQKQAFNCIGSQRLSERIREIEFMGFDIHRITLKGRNRLGNATRCTQYSMPKNRHNLKLLKTLKLAQ